ncbi:MAG: hypothetical protein WC964_03475 [Acholeplasmataceae bacterium]
MINAIILCVMVILSSLVIFLGMRYCTLKLDSKESLIFNRDFFITLYAKIAFIVLISAIIAFFSVNLYTISLKDHSNYLGWRYMLTIIFFLGYLIGYVLFNRKILRKHSKFSLKNLLGMEHAFGLIIGISYAVVLDMTFNFFLGHMIHYCIYT